MTSLADTDIGHEERPDIRTYFAEITSLSAMKVHDSGGRRALGGSPGA
jgi:hypothetical protein